MDWALSPLSRLLTVLYLIVGAPIMFMYLRTTGSAAARAMRFLASQAAAQCTSGAAASSSRHPQRRNDSVSSSGSSGTSGAGGGGGGGSGIGSGSNCGSLSQRSSSVDQQR